MNGKHVHLLACQNHLYCCNPVITSIVNSKCYILVLAGSKISSIHSNEVFRKINYPNLVCESKTTNKQTKTLFFFHRTGWVSSNILQVGCAGISCLACQVSAWRHSSVSFSVKADCCGSSAPQLSTVPPACRSRCRRGSFPASGETGRMSKG